MTAWLIAILLATAAQPAANHPDSLRARAESALRRGAAGVLRLAPDGAIASSVDHNGAARTGPDGQALSATQFVVGPHGAAELGLVLLTVLEATGADQAQQSATAVAKALAAAQLESGGWASLASPDEQWLARRAAAGVPAAGRRNVSELSSGATTQALALVGRVASLFGDPTLQQATRYGLYSLLRIQGADGSWPREWPPTEAGSPGDAAATARVMTLLLTSPWSVADAEARKAAQAAGEWLLAKAQDPTWTPNQETAALAAVALADLHLTDEDPQLLPAANSLLARWPARDAGLSAAAARVAAAAGGRQGPRTDRESLAWRTAQREREVSIVLASQGVDGLWSEGGRIDSATIAHNLGLLAEFVSEYERLPPEFVDDPARPPGQAR